MLTYLEDGQACLFDLVIFAGKMFPEHSPAAPRKEKTSGSSSKKSSELSSIPYMFLDLSEDAGNLLGEPYWEIHSPWRGDASMLNTGPAPRSAENVYSLWQILEEQPHSKYYLTRKACQGILRRAKERGKELPPQLEDALAVQAGLGENYGSADTPVAFAANQRDEMRDLHDVSAALCANPSVKQQTFIAAGVVSKGDETCVFTREKMVELDIAEESDERKTLCLNDQGGQFMNCTENVTGTLRSQVHGHPPILLESNQNHATVRTDGISTTLPASMGMGGGYVPMVYENHGKDARYKGPLDVAPTMSAAYGTGGNNVPLVEQKPETFCIVGNIIDRQPENGGNGLGCQKDIAYTLTGMDRHAVCDMTYQKVVGALCRGDEKGVGSQYVSQDKCVVESANLIRRLTPLECERLQGFPDYWTDIPNASDSARYKALGNSVAIPCVDYVMNGMRLAILKQDAA